MRCKQASFLIAAHLDGQLDQAKVAELEEHLSACSSCRSEWQRADALDQLFRSAPSQSAPANLRARVMARIDRREQARRAIVGGLALALGSTAVVLLALVPVGLSLLGNLGIGPALLVGGVGTITQLLALANSLARTLIVLLDQLSRPLLFLGLGSLILALMLNGLWIATVRRLRTARR